MKPKRTRKKKDNINILLIDEETPAKCEMCGNVEELRPYGPKGERVCISCGMKDEAAMKRAFRKRIKGMDVVIIR